MDQITQQAYHALNKPLKSLTHMSDLEGIAEEAKLNQIKIVALELERLITIQKLQEEYYKKNSSRDNCYGEKRPMLTIQLQETQVMLEQIKIIKRRNTYSYI